MKCLCVTVYGIRCCFALVFVDFELFGFVGGIGCFGCVGTWVYCFLLLT